MLFPYSERPGFTPTQDNRYNYCVVCFNVRIFGSKTPLSAIILHRQTFWRLQYSHSSDPVELSELYFNKNSQNYIKIKNRL
jgi:hypothetical protein